VEVFGGWDDFKAVGSDVAVPRETLSKKEVRWPRTWPRSDAADTRRAAATAIRVSGSTYGIREPERLTARRFERIPRRGPGGMDVRVAIRNATIR